jgi:hypothetical protein
MPILELRLTAPDETFADLIVEVPFEPNPEDRRFQE